MFKLINEKHLSDIDQFISDINLSDTDNVVSNLLLIIQKIYAEIPDKKRISYGKYSIIKQLGKILYFKMAEKEIDIRKLVYSVYETDHYDHFIRSLFVQIYSVYGRETGNLSEVLSLFEKAAADKHWEMRECSAGFIRPLTKKFPDTMHDWYLKMVKSEDSNQRRFASESLRPVTENRWFHKTPEYAFSIIGNLYKEKVAYPRTSVGNNLSDWMRVNPGMTWEVVKELAANGDKNSYWIAYRACRNYVKKEPLAVMNVLETDEYIYKERKYKRTENL